MVAEGAFFHHPSHAGRDLGGKIALHPFWKVTVPPVKISGMVRTGCLAVSAPYAAGVDLADDAGIEIHLGSRRRADRNTGRVMLTMHAWSGEIAHLGVGKFFAIGDLEKLHPGDAAFFVRFVGPDRYIVFCRTRDHACPATGAFVQIDDHSVSVSALFFFHVLPLTLRLYYFYPCIPPDPIPAQWVLSTLYDFAGINTFILLILIIGGMSQAEGKIQNPRHGPFEEVDTDL